MRAIILVPGILGSRLDLDQEEIWPPDLDEHLWGYERIDKLRNINAHATAVIGTTYLQWIYTPIINELNAIAVKLKPAQRVNFAYDWRDDIGGTANLLGAEIAKAVRSGATSVTLVCHSMGGLIARLLLEGGGYKNQPWFRRIDTFIAVCTPHLGAPVALGRALGLEPEEYSVRVQDQRALANDPNFPSVFQNFPVNRGALFDESVRPPAILDIYSAAVGTRYGLNHANQRAAVASWSRLRIGNKPAHVNYIFLAGYGHATSDQYYFNNITHLRTVKAPGDGTVPTWSSQPGWVQQYSFPGSHLDVMKTERFKRKLRELFGVRFMGPERPKISTVSLSLAKLSFEPDEAMEILVIPEVASSRIAGRLRVSIAQPADGSVSELSSVLLNAGIETSINYEGGAAAYISMKLLAPSTEGLYVLSFESDSQSEEEGPKVAFFVSQRDLRDQIVPQTVQKSAKRRRSLGAAKKRRAAKG